MKVAVIGSGYVGLTLVCLAKFGHKITIVDKIQSRVDIINNGISPIYEPGLEEILKENVKTGMVKATIDYTEIEDSDVVFVCVGTPSKEDGSIDLSQIETASRQIGQHLGKSKNYQVVVVKSTVVPKTTIKTVLPILEESSGLKAGVDFGVAMTPEFLREGSGVYDFINPDKIVIGTSDKKSLSILSQLYESFDSKIPRIYTDQTTAEMIKYAQNSMLASRISFMNEIANICEKFNVDVSEVAYAIGLDSRIGPKFLNAGIGFGGSCFPKDVKALIAASKSVGVKPNLLESIISVNENQPHRLIEIAKRTLGDLKNKKIAVLGLAFKSDTDDMRESRAIPVIETLLKEGSIVSVYDPKAMENAKKIFEGNILYSASKEDCVKNVDACMVLTEWKEFRDLELSSMKCPVIEGRRVMDPNKVIEAGLNYKSIGWKYN